MTEATLDLVVDKLESYRDDLVVGCSDDVSEEFTALTDVVRRVVPLLRDAEERRDGSWSRDLRQKMYEVEDEVEKLMMVAHDLGSTTWSLLLLLLGCCSIPIPTYLVGPKKKHLIVIRELRINITRFIDEHESFRRWISSSSTSTSSEVIAVNPQEEDEMIVSFSDDIKSKVEKILLEDEDKQITLVFITGMGGVGKTTLVKMIWNSREVKRNFDCSSWVSVSQYFNPQDILKSMLDGFCYGTAPYALETMNLEALVRAIKEFLWGKSYLLVLDDVWNMSIWATVAPALPNDSGGKIIFTNRMSLHDHLPPNIRHFVFRLDPLDYNSSLVLFRKNAFINTEYQGRSPPVLQPIVQELVTELQGLPLAIVAIGRSLRNKSDISEWKEALRKLQGIHDIKKNVSNVLRLTYDTLNFPARMILLYLSLFPKDHKIEVKRSLRLCVAEGFVEETQKKTAEEVANEGFQELIDKSMITPRPLPWPFNVNGGVESCAIHDLIIDLALSVIDREGFQEFHTNGNRNNNQQQQLPLRRLLILPNIEDMPDVLVAAGNGIRSFTVDGIEELPTSVMQQLCSQFRLLRVLDLEGTNISSLPDGLGTLLHLRYLGLKHTLIQELPASVSKLHKLLDLDIKDTKMRRLPDGISMLGQLRHIHLAGAYKSEVIDLPLGTTGVLVSAVQLETLAGVRSTTRLVEQLRSCTRIRKLSIGRVTGDDSGKLCVSINEMRFLQSLSIKCEAAERLQMEKFSPLDNNIKILRIGGPVEPFEHVVRCLNNLTRVYLWDNMLKEDPFSSLQQLPNLSVLSLNNAYGGKKISCNAGCFPKLKNLSILRMRSLECGMIEKGGMRELEFLFIGHCPNMVQLHGLGELPRLLVVKVSEMPEIFNQMVQEEASNNGFKYQYFPLFVYNVNNS